MKHEVVFRDGKVYVLATYPLDGSPKIRYMFWPTKCSMRTAIEYGIRDHSPCESEGSDGQGLYRLLEHPIPMTGKYLTIQLKDGGRTTAEHSELVSAPDPKVRHGIETRWYNGRWEKYLKTKGWVAA